MTFELRPYQQHTEHEARSALARGLKRVVLYMPTGGGKTLTATSIITKAVAKGRKVAFLANRKQLVKQTSAVLTRYNIAHCILQAENTRSLDAQMLVASIDTVYVRGLPSDVGLLIIDECHGVAGSEKYRKLLAKYNAVPVVGLTATPFAAGMGKHYDAFGGALFQSLVVGATIKDLIDDGYLVDCDIYAPSEPDLKKVRSSKGTRFADVVSRVGIEPAYNPATVQAAQKINQAIERDAGGYGVLTNPMDVIAARQAKLGSEATIADAGGQNTRQLLDTLTTLPGKAKDVTERLIHDRQQPIIRNVTTIDREPVVRVTTEDVLKVVRAYVGKFTTYDIAGVLDVEEYPVRAAMSWLVKRGIVEKVGTRERRLPPPAGRRLHGEVYPVSLYQVKEEAVPVDFAVLNRLFGYGC